MAMPSGHGLTSLQPLPLRRTQSSGPHPIRLARWLRRAVPKSRLRRAVPKSRRGGPGAARFRHSSHAERLPILYAPRSAARCALLRRRHRLALRSATRLVASAPPPASPYTHACVLLRLIPNLGTPVAAAARQFKGDGQFREGVDQEAKEARRRGKEERAHSLRAKEEKKPASTQRGARRAARRTWARPGGGEVAIAVQPQRGHNTLTLPQQAGAAAARARRWGQGCPPPSTARGLCVPLPRPRLPRYTRKPAAHQQRRPEGNEPALGWAERPHPRRHHQPPQAQQRHSRLEQARRPRRPASRPPFARRRCLGHCGGEG